MPQSPDFPALSSKFCEAVNAAKEQPNQRLDYLHLTILNMLIEDLTLSTSSHT